LDLISLFAAPYKGFNGNSFLILLDKRAQDRGLQHLQSRTNGKRKPPQMEATKQTCIPIP